MSDQIDRICPRCRVLGTHHTHPNVPPVYGASTASAVLATCGSTPGCEHQWRAILKPHERAALATTQPTTNDAIPAGEVERLVERSYWMGYDDGGKVQNENVTFDPAAFGVRVLAAMGQRTCRDVAPVIGISKATLNRVTRGMMPDLPTYFAVSRWLLSLAAAPSAPATEAGEGQGS